MYLLKAANLICLRIVFLNKILQIFEIVFVLILRTQILVDITKNCNFKTQYISQIHMYNYITNSKN